MPALNPSLFQQPMDYSSLTGQFTPANLLQYASPEGTAFALQQLQRLVSGATLGQPAQASQGSPYMMGVQPTISIPGTEGRMNAGEIAKIYSMYPNQQEADTAILNTLRSDFGYTPQQNLAYAINPNLAYTNPPVQPPAAQAPPPQAAVPQIPSAPIQTPPVQPPAQPAGGQQEYWGAPPSAIQQGAQAGAGRVAPVIGRGGGFQPDRGVATGPLQQLMQIAEAVRRGGYQR